MTMITGFAAYTPNGFSPWQSLAVPRDYPLHLRGCAGARARATCTSTQCQVPRDCQGLLGTGMYVIRISPVLAASRGGVNAPTPVQQRNTAQRGPTRGQRGWLSLPQLRGIRYLAGLRPLPMAAGTDALIV